MSALLTAFNERNKKQNAIEKLKNIKTMKEAFSDFKEYAKLGYENISKEDMNYYFKCFGVFDKRKENGENSFMIRVRIAGGQLEASQAKVLGEVSKEFAKDSLDLTTRMQVELRYITIEDLPTVLERLDAVGISTYQTGIDNIRNILTDPLDGVASDNIIEAMPIVKELQEVFFKQEEWIGKLPRKFNTAISGTLSNRCNILGHDCCFYLAKKDGVYGFNVALGGKVGVVASKADVFLKNKDEVVLFFSSLIKVFKEYGFRDNRNKNRLHFLIEAVGMDELIKEVKREAGSLFASTGEEIIKKSMFNPNNGSIKLRDETYALHSVVSAGVFSGTSMIDASRVASEFGDGKIRITYEQNIFILGVKEENKQLCLQNSLFKTHKNIDTPYINNLITCIGSKNCHFGIIETKGNILQDFEIFAKIGQYLGFKKEFDYADAEEVFKEYQDMCRLSVDEHIDIYKTDYKTLKNEPYVWGDNLFKNNQFLTPNKKANLFFVQNENLSEQVSKEFPFILLTVKCKCSINK